MKNNRSILIFTYSVIAICIVIFTLIQFYPESMTQAERAVLMGAYYKPFIMAGEWWRVITVGFVHISFMHLFMNLYSFYMISGVIHRFYGMKGYLAIFFSALIGGSLYQLFLADSTVAVGLSGALYGLMGAYFYMIYETKAYKIPALRRSLVQVIVINVLINFMGNVAVYAHLGGFVTGIIVALFMNPNQKNHQFIVHAKIAFLVYILCLGYMTTKIPDIKEVYLRSDYTILKYEYEHGLEKHAVNLARALDQLYDVENVLEVAILEGY